MPRGPRGLTHRQERFCRLFAKGDNATRAAVMAGYEARWAGNHGYRLLRQPRIRDRIAAIEAETASAVGREAGEVLLGKLEIVYRRALEDRHYPAAMRAVDLQARLAMRLAGDGAAGGPVAAPDDVTQAADSKAESGKMTKNDETVFGAGGDSRFFIRTCRL